MTKGKVQTGVTAVAGAGATAIGVGTCNGDAVTTVAGTGDAGTIRAGESGGVVGTAGRTGFATFTTAGAAFLIFGAGGGNLRPEGIEPSALSTMTLAPEGTRSNKSITSWLIMRMQPDEAFDPMDCHSGVP